MEPLLTLCFDLSRLSSPSDSVPELRHHKDDRRLRRTDQGLEQVAAGLAELRGVPGKELVHSVEQLADIALARWDGSLFLDRKTCFL